MKNIITAMSIFAATGAYAGGSPYAYVTGVYPVYYNEVATVHETQCREVRVPTYKHSRSGTGGDILAGMVIGGLLGKGITGDDKGAAVGAILGGMSAGGTQGAYAGDIVETHCETVPVRVRKEVLDYYIVEYVYDGQTYRTQSVEKFVLGQRIQIGTYIK